MLQDKSRGEWGQCPGDLKAPEGTVLPQTAHG